MSQLGEKNDDDKDQYRIDRQTVGLDSSVPEATPQVSLYT